MAMGSLLGAANYIFCL